MKKDNSLDNVAWSSLTNNHQYLGTIGKKAALYNPQVSMIATVKEETSEAFTELAEYATPGIPIALVGYSAPKNHPDWMVIRNARARNPNKCENCQVVSTRARKQQSLTHSLSQLFSSLGSVSERTQIG